VVTLGMSAISMTEHLPVVYTAVIPWNITPNWFGCLQKTVVLPVNFKEQPHRRLIKDDD